MNTIWFIILAVMLTSGAIFVGIVRNRRFKTIEDLHTDLAQRLTLEIAYVSPTDFTLFGTYRGYPIKIIPINLATPGNKDPKWFLKATIMVLNPVRKMLRISKRSDKFPELEKLVHVDSRSSLSHDLAVWLDIQTNDLMFSSIVLSENVKISIHQVFSQLESGLIYVEDNELSIVLPCLLTDKNAISIVAMGTETVCDLKDELHS